MAYADQQSILRAPFSQRNYCSLKAALIYNVILSEAKDLSSISIICLLWLSNDIAKECFEYQKEVVEKERLGEVVDFQMDA